MLDILKTKDKVVGVKQLRKAIRAGRAALVFLADDADPALTEPIEAACRDCGIPVERVDSMRRLGEACGITVGSACAATLHPICS